MSKSELICNFEQLPNSSITHTKFTCKVVRPLKRKVAAAPSVRKRYVPIALAIPNLSTRNACNKSAMDQHQQKIEGMDLSKEVKNVYIPRLPLC